MSSSCCDTSPPAKLDAKAFTVALAGNPNSGKTTLFNALTGLRQKVANYPGVTVEKKTGRCKLGDGRLATIIDLPGTYSLISRSPEEQVAMQVLRGLRSDTKAPDAVVVVVDASNLQRNLYLVSQLIELGRPLVVALNMMDVAKRRGILVDPQALARELGVPVIPVVGHKRTGIKELKAAIAEARVAPMPDWPLPEAMKEELVLVGGGLSILESKAGAPSHDALRLVRYQAMAERLLIGDRANDLREIASCEPVSSLLQSAGDRLSALGIEPMQADIEAHYRWIEGVVKRCLSSAPSDSTPQQASLSERADRIFIHKIWGLVIFVAIMATLFVSLFWAAQPIMDALGDGVKWLGEKSVVLIGPGPLKDLITQGIFGGVGAVVVFVPQIALLFLFLAVLEDSGYLARAAFLMDRLLSRVGLHGKSFIPLLSSFACAIPGIMATHTIESRKDRLATILVAPFMSCSARLPVYTLLIGTVFAASGVFAQAGIMLCLYGLGIVAAAGTAFFFKRSFLKGPATSFILEMPTYKVPQFSQVARQVWSNTWAFLTKAGTTIFFLSILLWAISYYPRLPEARIAQVKAQVAEGEVDHALSAAQGEHSIAGRIGHTIEPVIRPLGFDWKTGVGLVGAFAAREVFVSTMGIIYSVGEVAEGKTENLTAAMKNDRYPANNPRAGQAVWTPLAGVSLLIWFVLAMQCMSTVAIVRRETGGWRWPIFMIVYMNGLAYVACLAVFQIGRIWWT